MVKRIISEMKPPKPGQQLLNEPEEDDMEAPQTTDIESGEIEGEGDKVDVYGADDIDSTDSLDDEGGEDMSGEGGDDVDLDSEIDFEGEGEGEPEDPETLVHNLASALSAIMQYGDSSMSDDEAMEEAYKQIIGEDASVIAQTMAGHAARRAGAWQPDDFRTLGEDLADAAGESYVPRDLLGKIHGQRLYHVIESSSDASGVKIYEVVKVYEARDRAAALNAARSENQAWKDRYSDVADVDTQNESIQGLSRVHAVKNPDELRALVSDAAGKANRFVFVGEEVKRALGIQESKFGLAALIEGDAKSISAKTRKGGSVDKTNWAGMYDAAINAVSVAGKSGPKSRAPARKGDKSNADKIQSIQDFLRQASGKQVAALWKASAKMKTMSEAAYDAMNLTFSNEVDALMNVHEGMTEDQRDTIKIIFESAVKDKIDESIPVVVAALEAKKRDEITAIQEAIVKRLNSYLEYVVDNFMEANKVAIDAGLEKEISESFMSGMKSLLEQHYVTLPEHKEDLLESTEARVTALNDRLNEAKREAMAFKKKGVDLLRENTAYRLSKGLSDNQVAKLYRMLESIEFDSEQEFLMKARQLKETYFGKARPQKEHKEEDYATLMEQDDPSSPADGTAMNKYVNTLSRMSSKQ